MKDQASVKSFLKELFQNQQLAVLATREADGQPYTSLMAFAAIDDLRQILLVTSRSTRKYANLSAEPRVSLLIDSRSHRSADIHEAVAATVLGEAEEVTRHEDVFSLTPPQAAAIALPRCHMDISSTELIDRLIREKSVLVVPGEHFGVDRHLRASFGLPADYPHVALDRIRALIVELQA